MNGFTKKVASFHEALASAVAGSRGQDLTQAQIEQAYRLSFPERADDVQWIQAADHSRNHGNIGACTCAQTEAALLADCVQPISRALAR